MTAPAIPEPREASSTRAVLLRVSALPPIPRAPSLVSDSEHGRDVTLDLVADRVREAPKEAATHTVAVPGPHVGPLPEPIDCVEHFGAKRVCGQRTALEVPEESCAQFCLGRRQDHDAEPRHRALKRAFASAQGMARVAPARNCSRRRRISSRQASAMPTSPAPSRLSISATTSADRSSAGRSSASSSRWSTRAFIHESLAVGPAKRPYRRGVRAR